jgi:hypothetical protein
MHADYFAANQSAFNNGLLDLCSRNAPDGVKFADRAAAPSPGARPAGRGKREVDANEKNI